jgi:hypothetical protein
MDVEQNGTAPRVMQLNVANLYDFLDRETMPTNDGE